MIGLKNIDGSCHVTFTRESRHGLRDDPCNGCERDILPDHASIIWSILFSHKPFDVINGFVYSVVEITHPKHVAEKQATIMFKQSGR